MPWFTIFIMHGSMMKANLSKRKRSAFFVISRYFPTFFLFLFLYHFVQLVEDVAPQSRKGFVHQNLYLFFKFNLVLCFLYYFITFCYNKFHEKASFHKCICLVKHTFYDRVLSLFLPVKFLSHILEYNFTHINSNGPTTHNYKKSN